jgi:hypothetical protein
MREPKVTIKAKTIFIFYLPCKKIQGYFPFFKSAVTFKKITLTISPYVYLGNRTLYI